MSQVAGDFGSIMMGCRNASEIKKYGSIDACMKASMKARGKDYLIIGGSDTEKKVFEMQRAERQIKEVELKIAKERAKEFSSFKNAKNLFDKLTANPIIIGIVLVAGYFAYKKFKK